MRIFGSDRMKGIMDKLGVPDDMPIKHKLISKSIESAQKKDEGHNFDIRKHLVEYDDVINKHREVIYKRRKEVLEISENDNKETNEPRQTLRAMYMELIENEIEQVVSFHTSSEDEKSWNLDEVYEVVDTIFSVDLSNRIRLEDIREKAGDKLQDAESRTSLIKYLVSLADIAYDAFASQFSDEKMLHNVERAVYLRAIDTLWIEHLDLIDHLRKGIGLRGYGQQDPLVEYKKEAYRLFNELVNNIQKNVVYTFFKVRISAQPQKSPMENTRQQLSAPAKTSDQQDQSPYQNSTVGGSAQPTQTKSAPPAIEGTKQTAAGNLVTKDGEKVGRNDLCPCGSGKKYKKCHGK